MTLNNLRLLIIADDPLARAGLAALLTNQSDYTIVGQLSTEADFTKELAIYQPDVLIWDLGWNPAEMLPQLANLKESRYPSVVLLPDATHSIEVFKAGVQGLLLRDTEVDNLITTIATAAQQLITIDPALVDTLIPATPSFSLAEVDPLTPRELEVLQYLAQGLPNKAIARQMDISDHTVKFHVNAVMSKLGAQSRTEAVVRATQLGLILL